MFISAYDTLACRNILLTKITPSLSAAQISNRLITDQTQPYCMEKGIRQLPRDVGIYLEQGDTPQFAHPIIIPGSSQNDQRTVVVIDGRPLAKSVNYLKERMFVPNNYDMYEFQVLRAGITAMMLRGDTTAMSNLISPITKVVSLWIQRAIDRNYVVSQELASVIQTCGAVYVYAMFSGSSNATQEAKQLWSIRLHRDFPYLSKNTIERVIENTGSLNDVVQLVELIKRACDTPILQSLNTETFLQAISSGWDAFNSREMMSIAIEHLPTLIAVITKSQTQSFSKTAIGKYTASVLGSNLQNFIKSVSQLPLVSDIKYSSR